MSQTFGAWRASYSPGSWVVLAGPSCVVVMQPAAPRHSEIVSSIWGHVVEATDPQSLVRTLATIGLSRMPSLGVFFWQEGRMHSLARGQVRVVDASSGQVVNHGEGLLTWHEIGLDPSVVTVEMEPAPEGLTMPLRLGVVQASRLTIDASGSVPELVIGEDAHPPVPPRERADHDEAGDQASPYDHHGWQPDAPSGEGSAAGDGSGPDVEGTPGADNATGSDAENENENAIGNEDVPDDQPGQVRTGATGPLEGPAEEPVSPDEVVPDEVVPDEEPQESELPARPDDRDEPSPRGAQVPRDDDALPYRGEEAWSPSPSDQPVGGPDLPGADLPDSPVSPARHLSVVTSQPGQSPAERDEQDAPGERTGQLPAGSVPQRASLGRLVCSSGDVVDITGPVVVGRAPRGDDGDVLMRVPSPGQDISRTHLRVEPTEWGLDVTDMNSTNGTLVRCGGHHPVKLAPGQTIAVEVGDVIDLGDGVTITLEAPAT